MANVTSGILTESQVSEILLRVSVLGQTQTEVSQTFGVGRSTVGDIINGRTWKSVTPPKEIKKGYYKLADNRVYSVNSKQFLSVSLDKTANKRYFVATVRGKKEKIYL